ncbi:hypothetical protein [Ferruginibacter sp. SUN106]|uniref:hypothetical protein n=1 Tax=Ferruginibacter sp. SUN106 TaxID=2978348 RepID=UPI003D367893
MKFSQNKRTTARPAILIILLVLSFSVHCLAQGVTPADDNERKVDYFERIYFSGKNKADISALYLATIQELQDKNLSAAAEKQYNLLVALKDQVFEAESACDALEIIAVAIYSIDANTAINQGIKAPTEKVKKATFDEVSSALTSNVDSTSRANVYAAKAGEGKKILTAVTGIVFPKKDKPCKDVTPKVITIGLHNADDNAAGGNTNNNGNTSSVKTINTKITIKNIKYNQLSTIVSRIEKTEGISNLNSDNYSNSIAILEVKHTLKTKEIIDKILTANKELKIEVESISADGAILLIK